MQQPPVRGGVAVGGVRNLPCKTELLPEGVAATSPKAGYLAFEEVAAHSVCPRQERGDRKLVKMVWYGRPCAASHGARRPNFNR